jgi:phage tail-like protein
MAVGEEPETGVRVKVTIDNAKYDLGSFSMVRGIQVMWEIAEYRAGDGGNDRYICVGPSKYEPIHLERALRKSDTSAVREWLESNSFKSQAQTGKVELVDRQGETVMTWTLRNVMPSKWSMSPYDAKSSQVMTEVLELQHLGFLENE